MRTLTGYGTTGNKGTIDLYCMKNDLRIYLLNVWLGSLALPHDAKIKFQQVFQNHASYRKALEPYPDQKAEPNYTAPDTSWQAGWESSARLTLAFLEEAIFSSELDGNIKVGIKNRKVPEEIMQYQGFQDKVNPILDALTAEKAKAAAAHASPEAAVAAASACESNNDEDHCALEGTPPSESYWRGVAERMVTSHIHLFAEPQGEDALKQAILASPVGSISGDSDGKHHVDIFST